MLLSGLGSEPKGKKARLQMTTWKTVSYPHNPYRNQNEPETNMPLAIDARVARIKARVAELVGDRQP
jgi:hypothetical protein